MSNAIQYDPLLVRHLARALHERLRGRACASTPYFAAGRVAMLPLDRDEALEMDLHPSRGWFRIVPWQGDGYETDAVCLGVHSPADERRLTIRLDAPDRFRAGKRRLEVELHTNQWNVLLVADEGDRIHSALRARRAGERALMPGSEYRPPEASLRLGAAPVERDDAWRAWQRLLGGLAARERHRALVQGFSWIGTMSARWILEPLAAPAAGEAGLEQAFERWWWLRGDPPARPVVITHAGRHQPYPVALAGWEAEEAGSLLEAMGRVAVGGETADRSAATTGEGAPLEGLMAAARLRLEAAQRRMVRLEEERAREGEADRLRGRADLLLARMHEVPKGAARVVLPGWSGEPVEVELDPARTAADNASRLYAEARKRTRAAERLPALIEEAEIEAARWREAIASGEQGSLPTWVEEAVAARSGDTGSGTAEATPLPYRVFRSPGGLEIRVGRSSRANDQLTFGHSSPNDVWLHARSVPGSHVILRWRDPEGSPPARDLEVAARLAAYYSKARSSGLVPVDWTRRKYVRKPRGAAPGSVLPQRVRTLFVEPAEGVAG